MSWWRASAAAATPWGSSTRFSKTRTFGWWGSRRGDDARLGRHAARFAGGLAGILQGTRSYVLQDADGNIAPTHSISAGLDYAAVGPEHAWLHDLGRAEYTHVSDREALEAFRTLAACEGILPALESAHAVAYALAIAPRLGRDAVVLVNLSGRGDKDVDTVRRALDTPADEERT